MIAVTASCGIATETSLTAAVSPKNAVRFFVMMQGFSMPAESRGSATAARGAVVRGITRGSRAASVDCSTELGPGNEASCQADHEDDGDQDERACPCLGMPFVVGADGIGEDLERQRSDWLPQRG